MAKTDKFIFLNFTKSIFYRIYLRTEPKWGCLRFVEWWRVKYEWWKVKSEWRRVWSNCRRLKFNCAWVKKEETLNSSRTQRLQKL